MWNENQKEMKMKKKFGIKMKRYYGSYGRGSRTNYELSYKKKQETNTCSLKIPIPF